MRKRASPVTEISLWRGEIPLTEMKVFTYKHTQPAYRASFIQSAQARNFFHKKINMADVQNQNKNRNKVSKVSNNKKSQVKPKNFRWKPPMIEHLIDCLLEYKSLMSYKGLDFDGDKPMQYRELRLKLADIYRNDTSVFGPVVAENLPEDYQILSKEQQIDVKRNIKSSKDYVTKGTKRVMEKVKEIRQGFSKAIVSGMRSGSGKVVFEFFDKLVELWGGSANIEKLNFGIHGDTLFDDVDDNDIDDNNAIDDTLSSIETSTSITNNNHDNSSMVEDTEDEEQQEFVLNKRKNCVPHLIDNKRKHLERKLSAAQREQLLIREAKEDAQFRKDLSDAMRESTASFTESIKEISKSMSDIGSGICRSIEMLSHVMLQQGQNQNQNMFYHGQAPSYSQMLNPSWTNNNGGHNSQHEPQSEPGLFTQFPTNSNKN